MPKDNSAEIQELQNTVQSLQTTVKDLQTKIEDVKNTPILLDRYLDSESKDIISDTIKERIIDIVWDDYFYYSSTFESIDRYLTAATGATQIINSDGLYLETLGTGANETDMELFVSTDLLSINKDARFRISNKVNSITNISWGAYTLMDSLATSYVGFDMINGTIYGITSKAGATTSVDLGSYSADTYYKLELYFTPTRVRFYVDGIEKGTSVSNIPIAIPNRLFSVGIGETSASARSSTTSYFEFIQKK